MSQVVLVTVGTTIFEALIRGIDSEAVTDALKQQGYQRLIVQHGKTRLHEYLPNLADIIEGASLVISHCGAGSVFEALSLGVRLLTVPNPILMDNHQAELASLLEQKGYAVRVDASQVQCAPENVAHGIAMAHATKLVPYEAGNADGIVKGIDALFQETG